MKNRLHRPALRRRDPRRVRVPLPPDRRAPRATPSGRSADDLRRRLHHLEERVPRGLRPRTRRHGPAVRQRPHPRHPGVQPLLGVDLQQPAHAGRRDRVAAAAGPVVPGAARVPRAQPAPVRRPDLLHVSLRPDRARRADRAAQDHPGADGARRAGDSPRDLQGAVQPAGRHGLQHRRRAPVPDDALLDPRRRRGDGRLRRRPAPVAAARARGGRRSARSRGRCDGR